MKLPRRLIGTPIRPDRWTAMRFASLRWAALPVIDRRWTVPMSAMALAFGIFVGIAIGPATEGSLGSQMQTVVSVVSPPVPTPLANGARDGNSPGGSGQDNGQDPTPTPAPSPPSDDGPFDNPTPAPTPIPTPPPVITPTTPTTTTTTPDATDDSGSDDSDSDEAPVPTLVKGAVVHINEFADSYTVARRDGTLTAVHAQKLPALGDVIEVQTRVLANGTRAEDGDRDRAEKTDRFDLSGTVTFSDPRIGAYTLSVPGSSLLIRVPAGTRMPQVADTVEVSARIADKLDPIEAQEPGRDGCGTPPRLPRPRKLALEQTKLSVTDEASAAGLEAIVQGVCRKSGSLIVSADDVRESGRDIAVVVSDELRLRDLTPGQVVKIRADIGKSGNLTATAIADDEGESAADDSDRVQR